MSFCREVRKPPDTYLLLRTHCLSAPLPSKAISLLQEDAVFIQATETVLNNRWDRYFYIGSWLCVVGVQQWGLQVLEMLFAAVYVIHFECLILCLLARRLCDTHRLLP